MQGRRAFDLVFAARESTGGRYFRVYFRPNGLTYARLGVVVGKSLAPRASTRNFCKRMVRETFRELKRRIAGVDLVVRARAVSMTRQTMRARKELRELLLCGPGRPARH